jgi:hypothetical protein
MPTFVQESDSESLKSADVEFVKRRTKFFKAKEDKVMLKIYNRDVQSLSKLTSQ